MGAAGLILPVLTDQQCWSRCLHDNAGVSISAPGSALSAQCRCNPVEQPVARNPVAVQGIGLHCKIPIARVCVHKYIDSSVSYQKLNANIKIPRVHSD